MAQERENRRSIMSVAKSTPGRDTMFMSGISPYKTMSDFDGTPQKLLYFQNEKKKAENEAPLPNEEYKTKLRKREINFKPEVYDFDLEPYPSKYLKKWNHNCKSFFWFF